MHTRWIPIAAATLLASQALAGGMKVEPGNWEFRSTSRMPMAPNPTIQVNTQCVTDEEISPESFMKEAEGCTVTESESSDSMMRWKMSCSNPAGEMTGKAEFSSTGATVRGMMNMAMTFNGQPMAFDIDWEGRRIGPCE